MLLLLVACRETPAPDLPLKNVITTAQATTRDTSILSAKEWTFTLRGETYRLARDGRFTCGTRGSFQLDLGELPYVDQLQYVPHGSEILIVLYEQSDGEGSTSKVARVYLPDCELAFASEIPGFNLGTAALEGSKLYVSTIGFVGRFDVETWGYDWTHGNLYERHRFNAFEAPVIYRERVVFREVRSDARPPRSVVVDKLSGAIRIE
ncbi:MAG TPA: hypothetical protein VF266_04445 [Thermoanaerobaculia bacterium]